MLARMTDGSEMIKVLDFGIARIVKGGNQQETQESQRITKAGEVFGTPAYMSPEQARSIRQLKPSADLYSLGVMFYELVNGGLPFFAHSAFDLLMLHVTKPVPPIRRGGVPEELQEIIYRLLEKDPEKRFQSGKELVEALDELELPDEEISVDDLESGPTLIQPTPTPTIGTPPPLGDEQTNPEAPPGFSVTTPPADPASHSSDEARRPTMMLDGSDEVIVETGDFTNDSRRNRLIAFAAVAIVGVVVGGIVLWGALREQSAKAETTTEEPTQAEVVEPDDAPPNEMNFDEPTSLEREIAEAATNTPTPDEETKDAKPAAVVDTAPPTTEPKEAEPEEESAKPKTKPKRTKRTRRRPRRRPKPKPKPKKPSFERMRLGDDQTSDEPDIPRVPLD